MERSDAAVSRCAVSASRFILPSQSETAVKTPCSFAVVGPSTGDDPSSILDASCGIIISVVSGRVIRCSSNPSLSGVVGDEATRVDSPLASINEVSVPAGLGGTWAEMIFSVGLGRAKGFVSILDGREKGTYLALPFFSDGAGSIKCRWAVVGGGAGSTGGGEVRGLLSLSL